MITIDNASPVPPFEQIRAQLSGLIRSGTLQPGHRLPSIRQLAGDLQLATGTVARAYSELETAALIETSRATGARVCAGHNFPEDLKRAASRFVTTARANALSLEDALGAIRSQWPRG
jgi:GntR family transcriptional regulator